jgi:hypothetical protein
MKNIKLIRLLSGDTIIAEILGDANDDFIEGLQLKRPVRIVVLPRNASDQYDPKAQHSVGFAPWVDFTEDEELVVNLQHVVTMATPIEEFVKQYKGLFTTLITPENSGLIVPK